MGWFRRDDSGIRDPESVAERGRRSEGLWDKCPSCGEFLYREDLELKHGLCPSCGHHFPRNPEQWVGLLLDPGSFEAEDTHLQPVDSLGFKDSKRYDDRLKALAKRHGVNEAFVSGRGRIDQRPVQFGVFDFRFLGGSMGSVVGERIYRLVDRGCKEQTPAIVLSASGGARMQEGVLSLMQMAKTSAAVNRLRQQRLPFISVLLHPTTGGVAASFAMQGDVIVVEPNALIGFAGPRVIEQTIRQKLPEGFQRSEFLLEHGLIDMIVPRDQMRATLQQLLAYLMSHADRGE